VNATKMNPDQVDALQELMNIAMGQAADRLARLVEQQIILSIPKIHAKKGRIPDSDFSHLNDPERSAIITRQSFLGALRGEVLVCFGASGANKLAHLMGYSTDDNGDIDDASNKELVLDITNILAGACI
jgi:chemotaxis protein CheC